MFWKNKNPDEVAFTVSRVSTDQLQAFRELLDENYYPLMKEYEEVHGVGNLVDFPRVLDRWRLLEALCVEVEMAFKRREGE